MAFCQLDRELVYYERHGTPGSRILLFVHGAGGTAETWRLCVSYLTQFECILVDLPGHYRSEGIARSSITEYADFLYRFTRAIAPEIGDNLIFVGHSMGGAIGIEIVCQDSPWIQQLVLVTTGSRLKVNDQFLTQLSAGTYDLSFVQAGFGSAASYELIRQVVEHRSVVSVESSYRDFLACNQFDRRNDLAGIKIPTLIIAGEEDRITAPVYSVYMNERITNSKLVQVSQTGHFLPLEHPIGLATAIISFLTDRDSSL